MATKVLHLEQVDTRKSFLNGDLDEDIYMTQSEYFHMTCKEIFVCKLKKRLHRLKKTLRK